MSLSNIYRDITQVTLHKFDVCCEDGDLNAAAMIFDDNNQIIDRATEESFINYYPRRIKWIWKIYPYFHCYIFEYAVDYSCLDIMKWCCRQLDTVEFSKNMQQIWSKCFKNGNLGIVAWLSKKVRNFGGVLTRKALGICCKYGNFQVLLWLRHKKPKILQHAKYMFRVCCQSNHLVIAEWLLTQADFTLSPRLINSCPCADAKMRKFLWNLNPDPATIDADLLEKCCKNDNLKMAKWVYKILSENCVSMDFSQAFTASCKYNSHHVAKWLHKIDASLVHDIDVNLVLSYAGDQDVDFAKWLLQILPNASADTIVCMFTQSCDANNIDMCKWLLRAYPDMQVPIKSVTWDAALCGNLKLCKWLSKKFPCDFAFIDSLDFTSIIDDINVYVVDWIMQHTSYSPPQKYDNDCVNVLMYNALCNGWFMRIKLFHKFYPELSYKRTFEESCKKGYLDIAQWAHEIAPTDNTTEVFSQCFHQNNLRVIEWLYERNPDINIADYQTEFYDVCCRGFLVMAQWMLQKADTLMDEINAFDAFVVACENDYYYMAAWIMTQTQINIRHNNDRAFRETCRSGRYMTVKWLQNQIPNFKFVVDDNLYDNVSRMGNVQILEILDDMTPIQNHASILENACENGDGNMIKWLCKKYNIKLNETHIEQLCRRCEYDLAIWAIQKFADIDMRKIYNSIFAYSYRNPYFAKWLLARYPDIDVRYDNYKAFEMACYRNDCKFAQWLYTLHPEIDVCRDDNNFFCSALKRCHLTLLKWLYSLHPDMDIHAGNYKMFRKYNSNAEHDSQDKFAPNKISKWLQEKSRYTLAPMFFWDNGKYIINPDNPQIFRDRCDDNPENMQLKRYGKTYHEINIDGCVVFSNVNFADGNKACAEYIATLARKKSARSG